MLSRLDIYGNREAIRLLLVDYWELERLSQFSTLPIDQASEFTDMVADLKRAIRSVKYEYRTTIFLHYIVGHSQTEVGRIMGELSGSGKAWSQTMVGVMIREAIDQIECYLKENGARTGPAAGS